MQGSSVASGADQKGYGSSPPQFSPAKKRETSVVVLRNLQSGAHFLLLSLSTRDDTLLIRVDPLDGSLHFDWQQGIHVFPSEYKAMDSLRSFGDLDVRAKACTVLGYAAVNDTGALLLATRIKPAVTMPGGHRIMIVTESQWVKIPLQGNGELMSRDEAKKVDLLTEFPLDGAHFFCETVDITRPFPSDCIVTEPAWEWVWNRYLSSPFRALGLPNACPNLQQGMAESRTLPDTSGRPWVLTKISRRSRLHPGTRYLARGLNEQYSAGNEIECEQLVWDLPSVPQDPVRWSSFVWRRGSVPIWWGVEIKNSGVGEAEIWVNTTHTYRGSRTYFKRLQERYIPHFPQGRQTDPEEAPSATGAKAAAGLPVTCINLLRCAMGKSEVLLSEHFHEAVRHVRKADPSRQIQVLNFDWHAMVKGLGEEKAVEGLWSILGTMQPLYGISCGTMGPGNSAGCKTTTWPGGWVVHWNQEQAGVLRFNCADSLDRTNVASYFSATESLVEQTKACGFSIVGAQRRQKFQQQQQKSAMEKSLSVGSLTKVLPKSLAKSVDNLAAKMGRSMNMEQQDVMQQLGQGTRTGDDEVDDINRRLPEGWEARRSPDGKIFYADHIRKATQWKPPKGMLPATLPEQEPPQTSESEADSEMDSSVAVSSETELMETPEWGLFGWDVEQVKAHVLPDVISTHAELFMINGDLQAMFYTASRAMHSQSINLLEGKRARPHSSRLGAVTNAGVAVQRRFINLVQDESRMTQMEVFLGLKMGMHFPSIQTPYSEPILPDDVSDEEEDETEAASDLPQSGPTKISAGAAKRTERAATAAFTAATRAPSQPFGSQILEAMDNTRHIQPEAHHAAAGGVGLI